MVATIEGYYQSPAPSHQTIGVTVTEPVESTDTLIAVIISNQGPSVPHPTGLVGLGADWSRVSQVEQRFHSAWVGVGASGLGEVETSPDSLNLSTTEGRAMALWRLSGVDPEAMIVATTVGETSAPAWTPPLVVGAGVFIGFGYSHGADLPLLTIPEDGWAHSTFGVRSNRHGSVGARTIEETDTYSVGSQASSTLASAGALFLPEASSIDPDPETSQFYVVRSGVPVPAELLGRYDKTEGSLRPATWFQV